MADDLPAVLTLLYDSGKRWRTLRAEGEEWVDDARNTEAFLRSVPPGAVVTSRGRPGPADHDPVWKVWVRQPHQSRADFGMAHRTRALIIADGHRLCMSNPAGGYRIVDRRSEHDASLGPAAVLLRPFVLPSVLTLQTVGRERVIGRDAVVVRGRPRPDADAHIPGLPRGADEIRFAVDRERGVLLWLETWFEGAPYRRITISTVVFDEDLDDDLFAFPEVDGDPPPVPGHPRRPPLVDHREGPPDLVLGVPVGGTVVVARQPSFVVAVDRVTAYPTGFELGITVRTHDAPVHGSFDAVNRRSWSGTAAFPGQSLRVRVTFDNGASPNVVPISGSGTQARFDQRFWVTPLPPPGPVGVVVAWPSRGLAETRADVDGSAIVEAAARAEALWS